MKKSIGIKQACIYARVSTEEQQKEGFSIPAQLKMLREYSRKYRFSVVKEFVDSETARSTGRTGFNAMLSFMDDNKECKVILVEKTDRLTRNMKDYIALDVEKSGIEIHFVRDGKVMSRESSPSAHFIQDIEIAQAAYISRNISSEAKKGMKAKAEAGLYPSVAPLGYRNTSNASGVKIIAPDNKTAPLIAAMFERYASGGLAIEKIARDLFEDGLRTRRGNRLSKSTVHNMLRSPIYRGKFIWNGIEYNGKHKPLISSELWFRVQDMLADRSVAKPKQSHVFPYIGLIKCGHCGCSITAERRKGKYSYYHCTGYKGKHGEPHMREEKLTEQFTGMLKDLSLDREIADWILGDLKDRTHKTRDSRKATRERLLSRQSKLYKRSEMLYDDRLEGRISASRFDTKNLETNRELELVDEKLAGLDSNLFIDPLQYATGIIELAQNAHSLFVTSSGNDRKQFLQNLLSNCTLKESKIAPTFSKPFAVLADTNARWKLSGHSVSDISAVSTYWHSKTNSKFLNRFF